MTAAQIEQEMRLRTNHPDHIAHGGLIGQQFAGYVLNSGIVKCSGVNPEAAAHSLAARHVLDQGLMPTVLDERHALFIGVREAISAVLNPQVEVAA